MHATHKRVRSHGPRALTTLAIAASAAALLAGGLAPAHAEGWYPLQGRAYGIGLNNITILGQATPSGAGPDTGLVQTWNTTDTKPECGNDPNPVIGATLLCPEVSTNQDDQSVDSTATLATARIAVPGLPVVDIAGVKAEAKAGCGVDPTATTTIAYLKVGNTVVIGQRTQVRPNTVVNVGALKLILNEQSTHASEGTSSSSVAAIRLKANVLGLVTADVVVSSAMASASCWAL